MTRLENEAQYNWAMAKIEELLPLVDEDTPLEDPLSMELLLLSNLVADYDEIHYPIGIPSLSDIIKLRMYEMNLTQKALAELLGVSAPRISEYLTGKSEPTLKVARIIATKLSISPNIILGIG